MWMYLGILWYFVMMLKCIDANRLKTATLSNVLKEVKNDVLGVTEMQVNLKHFLKKNKYFSIFLLGELVKLKITKNLALHTNGC